MALRGKKPTTIEKRLKALFYGTAGVGKTTASIQFPRPYLIDTERGAENDQYVEMLENQGGAIFQTSDFDEMIQEITSLLTEKHEYKTLIIDPLTTVYNQLLDSASEKVGTEFGRHYGEANKRMKHLLNLLLRLDMNVIITSHAKNEYGKDLSVLGQTFDCYKKLDYLFDLVIEIQKRGTTRVGVVKKSRVKNFEENESFTFSYQTMSEKYGKNVLERDAIPQELATEDQIKKINQMVELLKISDEYVLKVLSKAHAETIEEMPKELAQKWLDSLLNKINDNA